MASSRPRYGGAHVQACAGAHRRFRAFREGRGARHRPRACPRGTADGVLCLAEYPTPIVAEGIVLEPVSLADYEARANEEAREILQPVVRQAEAAGVACASEHLIATVPWEAILRAAAKVGADAIVMASHGRRGLSAMLLGSETQRVLTHSTIPVVVVRG